VGRRTVVRGDGGEKTRTEGENHTANPLPGQENPPRAEHFGRARGANEACGDRFKKEKKKTRGSAVYPLS